MATLLRTSSHDGIFGPACWGWLCLPILFHFIYPVVGLQYTVHRVPKCLLLRRNWPPLPPPPSPASELVSLPLGPKGGGATLACGWRCGGTQFGRLDRKPALCILCDLPPPLDWRRPLHLLPIAIIKATVKYSTWSYLCLNQSTLSLFSGSRKRNLCCCCFAGALDWCPATQAFKRCWGGGKVSLVYWCRQGGI